MPDVFEVDYSFEECPVLRQLRHFMIGRGENETLYNRKSHMNQDINAEILAELRSLRRHNQFGAYFCIMLMLIVVAYISWSVREGQGAWSGRPRSQSAGPANVFSSEEVWSKISAALDEGDDQKALSIAQDFVARRPNYYYSHATLGSAYIALGDFTNAEAAYARAVDLYPEEEYEKALGAVRKRLARDRAARPK